MSLRAEMDSLIKENVKKFFHKLNDEQ
jgi:hypothetical protein